jgi:hypothetical protein
VLIAAFRVSFNFNVLYAHLAFDFYDSKIIEYNFLYLNETSLQQTVQTLKLSFMNSSFDNPFELKYPYSHSKLYWYILPKILQSKYYIHH